VNVTFAANATVWLTGEVVIDGATPKDDEPASMPRDSKSTQINPTIAMLLPSREPSTVTASVSGT
jgi:hypothetical protein